ncbi:MAG: M50 family metallopeptidase [Elusimicrobiota bacterium]|nr:M50 family metallopeptidase [Endomicrobiia bacterium]MCX7910589.1 M50 family metallopeptidase [Endomicrobiia bacterium]MDW8164948.1 M50 family metallopeptidase [Elusimicrobiota bacterium]
MLTVLLIIFAFGLLIFFHEFGHFIIAKILKIKVLQFCFGLGKEIIGKTIGETRYSLCLLPLGGAVRLKGENIEELDTESDSFFGKKWYQRMLVVVMGPFMNYVLAVIIFFMLLYFFGLTVISDEPVIGEVIEGKPAAVVGLKQNDRILKVNDIEINSWSKLAEVIHNSAGKKILLKVLRNNNILYFEIIPEEDPTTKKGIIGITPGYKVEKVNFIESLKMAVYQPIFLSIFSVKYLIDKIIKFQKPEIAGPVGIVQVLSKAAKAGLENFLYTVGVISSMLALFNLFPIPVLDGGHVMFCFLEAITKKLPSKKLFEISNLIGLTFLFSLLLFATYSDILRIIKR